LPVFGVPCRHFIRNTSFQSENWAGGFEQKSKKTTQPVTQQSDAVYTTGQVKSQEAQNRVHIL
jgi:hypothetical protein